MILRDVPDVVVQDGARVLRMKLSERSQDGADLVQEFLDQLVKRGLSDLFNREGLGSLSRASFVAGIRGAGSRGVLERVILVSELFGSVQSFVDECRSFSRNKHHRLERATIKSYRDRLLVILDGAPGMTRSQLASFHSYRALCRKDAKWVDARVPASKAGQHVGTGGRPPGCGSVDIDAAIRSIGERAEFVRQKVPPVRISLQSLALPAQGLDRRKPLPFPIASAIRSVEESRVDFWQRWIQWAEIHPEAFRSETYRKNHILRLRKRIAA
jgi:hypothetical protein